jgi:hypothetical protein
LFVGFALSVSLNVVLFFIGNMQNAYNPKGAAVAQLVNRKVAGSIPDGAIGFFHWHNPSSRTMALGSTQPLTEMSTRNISWRVNAAVA